LHQGTFRSCGGAISETSIWFATTTDDAHIAKDSNGAGGVFATPPIRSGRTPPAGNRNVVKTIAGASPDFSVPP